MTYQIRVMFGIHLRAEADKFDYSRKFWLGKR